MRASELYGFLVRLERVERAKQPKQVGKEWTYVTADCTGKAVPKLGGFQGQVAEMVRKGSPPAMN